MSTPVLMVTGSGMYRNHHADLTVIGLCPVGWIVAGSRALCLDSSTVAYPIFGTSGTLGGGPGRCSQPDDVWYWHKSEIHWSLIYRISPLLITNPRFRWPGPGQVAP